ncbi:MAG: FAA hydrolase family protein [Dehalococcoidia bacterium]|nr:FAA hydrolase family protein [Dehalococcoidia bacterium]
MHIIRYRLERRTGYGIVERNRVFALEGRLFGAFRKGPLVANLSEVRLLAPVKPAKILAIGKNYAAHAKELSSDVPSEPLIFIKANSSLNGPGDPIVAPAWAGRVDHEGELVAVIGKKASRVSEDDALDYVFGYTCGNDVTARELQTKDGQWARAKSFDTFACIGPWVVTGGKPEGRKIECRVNETVRQSSNTDMLIFGLPRLISHISRAITLYPGDIIYTGTPEGIGPIKPGNVVDVEIQGIGLLRNPVIAD